MSRFRLANRIALAVCMVFLLCFPPSIVLCDNAPGTRQTSASPDNTFVAKGDSTLHAFTITAGTYTVQLEAPALTTLEELQTAATGGTLKLSVTVSAKGLESGKDKMNNLMWDTLKVKPFPEITFTSQTAVYQGQQDNAAEVTFKGELTIAGKTNATELATRIHLTPVLRIQGTKDLKMSAFGMDPPTAMMGMMKTKDDVTVEFDWKL